MLVYKYDNILCIFPMQLIIYNAYFLCSLTLFFVDLSYLGLYIIEFGLRLVGHGRDYLPRSLWGFLDAIIIAMAIVTTIGTLLTPMWEHSKECEEYLKGH